MEDIKVNTQFTSENYMFIVKEISEDGYAKVQQINMVKKGVEPRMISLKISNIQQFIKNGAYSVLG